MWTTIKRIGRYGLIGFIRNGFVSLASVLVMTVTLFVIVTLVITGAALGSVLKQLTEKVDVTIYFTTDATDAQITQMQTSLKALPEVASVTSVSRDEALAQFQERHANDQLTMQALEELGANPLGASLEIRAKQTSQYDAIARYIEAQQTNDSDLGSAIDSVNYYQNKTAIDRLSGIINTSRAIGLGIALLLAIASVVISFNTIRLAIYTAREEIGVMNLVGASPWYVRGPFVISGVLYGVVSAVTVLLLLYPITLWLGPGSEQFFGSFNVFSYFVAQFPLLFLLVMGSGMALGALSSYLAVRRYLRA